MWFCYSSLKLGVKAAKVSNTNTWSIMRWRVGGVDLPLDWDLINQLLRVGKCQVLPKCFLFSSSFFYGRWQISGCALIKVEKCWEYKRERIIIRSWLEHTRSFRISHTKTSSSAACATVHNLAWGSNQRRLQRAVTLKSSQKTDLLNILRRRKTICGRSTPTALC